MLVRKQVNLCFLYTKIIFSFFFGRIQKFGYYSVQPIHEQLSFKLAVCLK